jgi:putative tryptophan/tyrosine transport system substrate-binding protein
VAARGARAAGGQTSDHRFLGANPSIESSRVAAFVQRLRELGWIDGRNLAIEYRWAEGRNERYAENAAELVRLKVDVIVTSATPPTVAAKQATAVIPIVFAAVTDPVGTGVVATLSRPGGNVTGLANQISDTAGKKLEFLREIVPDLRRLAIMINVGNPGSVMDMREAEAAARTLGLLVTTSEIRRAEDIGPAFGGGLSVRLGPRHLQRPPRIDAESKVGPHRGHLRPFCPNLLPLPASPPTPPGSSS